MIIRLLPHILRNTQKSRMCEAVQKLCLLLNKIYRILLNNVTIVVYILLGMGFLYMSSFDKLARNYANRLLNSVDMYLVADEIVREIKNLIYSDTKKKISDDDKRKLINLVHHYLNYPPNKKANEFELILEKSDNKDFLSLINHINDKLTGGN